MPRGQKEVRKMCEKHPADTRWEWEEGEAACSRHPNRDFLQPMERATLLIA